VISRPLKLIGGGVVLWFVATMAFWAFRPMTDRVQTTVDRTFNPPKSLVVAFRCHAPAQSGAWNPTPTPTFNAQPAGQPPVTLMHEPCEKTHGDARALFFVNIAVMLAFIAGAVWYLRRRRSHESAEPRPASSGPAIAPA
jgi:hypothetical protein